MPYCPKTKFSLNVEHYLVILTSLTSQIVKKKDLGVGLIDNYTLVNVGL